MAAVPLSDLDSMFSHVEVIEAFAAPLGERAARFLAPEGGQEKEEERPAMVRSFARPLSPSFKTG